DVDDQRCVIRGYRLSLPRLAIDLVPDHAMFLRAPSGQVIDAHAEVFMEIVGAVVPPRVPPRFRVMQSVGIDEPALDSHAKAGRSRSEMCVPPWRKE
ncbi:MAG TPA: hypothetical protein VJV04_00415, partial [Nitrospiraceae bacterium]|nr:hypothetical protein [Nitrospiraceae bacterium]